MIKKSKISRNVLASSALMSLVLSASLNVTSVKAEEAAQVNRFGGDTRFKTAEEVAKNLFKTSENVVIVNGLGYADAVSAAPFAKQLDAPILLTKGQEAEGDLLQTLKELGAKNVYVIGGEGVVSSKVLDDLKDYKVERIGGNTRYETNAEIAKRVLAKSGTKGAILVNAEDGYADSLSAAPIAAKKGYAILFANSREVPKVVSEVAKGLEVIAVGGQKVLPDAVVQSVGGKRVTEKASNRFETNLSLLNYFKSDLSFDNIFVASGGSDSTLEFADSLVASAVAAKFGSPLVLSGLGADGNNRNLALEYIKVNVKSNSKISLIGSTGVMSSDIEESIKKILSGKVVASTSSGSSSSSGSTPSSTTSAAVSIDNLNTAGNYTGDATISSISSSSVFGPASGTTVLKGNLNISVPNAAEGQSIKLRNLDVSGNINVDFGSGNIELENVTVNGVKVTNIGQNSLHIEGNTNIGVLNIQDTDGNAHVVIESNTAVIGDTNINSGAKLELGAGVNSTNPFGVIKISPEKDGDTVILSGTYGSVEVEKGVKLQIAPGAKILGNLVVKSGADISLGDNAVVKKLDISSENETDKITLNGSFTSIEINKKANIEIQSGNSNIVSNVQTDVNVTTGASITVRGDADNITNKGEGSSQVNSNPSSEKQVEAILINGASIQNGSEIKDVTAGIKVSKFLQSLQLSDFATAWVVELDGFGRSGVKLADDDYLSDWCTLVVQAENGIDKKYYGVSLAQDNSRSSIRVQLDGFKDNNLEEDKLSGTLNFSILESEENVQGYYVTIEQRSYENGFISQIPVAIKYVPFDSTANKKYSVNIDSLNISGSKDLRLLVEGVYKNRTLIPQGNEDWNLIDLPKNVSKPSNEGINISFTDTDTEKGKVAGTITFTKANDESNVKYYEIHLDKAYEVGGTDTSTYYQLGYVEASGNAQYTYEVNSGRTDYMELENAKDISIIITALNEFGEPANVISKHIDDVGSNGTDELKVPVLRVSDSTTVSAITVDNVNIDTEIRLYIYDESTGDYVPCLRDGKQIALESHGDRLAFYDLEPGKYKATQYINGKESAKSEEIVLKPLKLYVVVEGSGITIFNARFGDSDNIDLYDENNNFIRGYSSSEVVNNNNKIGNLAPGKYRITQYVNKLESDATEFEIIGSSSGTPTTP